MKTFTPRKFTTFLAMPILAAGILSGAAITTASAANAAGGHGGASHSAVAAGPRGGGTGTGSRSEATPVSSLSAQTNIGAIPNVSATNRVGLQVEPNVNVENVPSPSVPAVNVQTVNH